MIISFRFTLKNNMGHDIDIRECPTRFEKSCGHHNDENTCNHPIAGKTYMSGNFYNFDEWSVYKIHGRTGEYCLAEVKKAISELEAKGAKPEVSSDETEWTPSKNVFLYHLYKFKELFERHPTCRFWSDQVYDRMGDSESEED
jgi:hypothetical protein